MTERTSGVERVAAAVLAIVCVMAMIARAAFGATASPTPQFSAPASAHGRSSPTPMPSAKDCDLFKQLSAPSTEAFDAHKLTAAQRSYVLKYVKKIDQSERRYARWMVDTDADNPHASDAELIFDALPVYPEPPYGSHASWLAINTNVGLDPVECRMFATPIAYGGQVRPANGRI